MLAVKIRYFNIVLLSLLLLNCVTSDGQFECGEHGRFEYCIDEIPGCVIGCHCHPGYYFDTDTKICELNIKLTQNYRRQYNIEHTISEKPFETFEFTQPTPPVTTDLIDNQVNEITKNADDLGDWLYNQFFKTIENQVINNTKENDILTRRSGSPEPIKNMSQRRSSRKRKKKKQRLQKSSIRRKLLRITENDSVFDSSKESRSDSSESSSDESDDATFEIEQSEDKHKNDKEHGHKKIVIINKKPKPPLPSFIFLPNMDTPFYPPIGLPPPPIMPMYPLVPVPPMPAILCPEQETSGTSTVPGTTMTTTTSAIPTTQETSGTTTPELTEVEDTTPPTINSDVTTQKEPAKSGRSRLHKQRNRLSRIKQNNAEGEPYIGSSKRKPLQGSRQKLLQQLRQRISNPAKIRPMRPQDSVKFNKEEMLDTPLTEDNIFDETLNNEIQSNPYPYTNLKPENVDFKYISELIHRVDLNNTRDLPPIEYNSKDSVEIYKPRKTHKVKNQENNTPIETRRSNTDDSYYTNLGRQIASIIRNADAQNKQVDIEIEQTEQKNENHVFFNDNSPRSFWERSVRSPLKFLNSNKNKYDYLKKSNELLFNIENKVTIMASTAPSLTLQEIENIVKVMEKAQSKIKNQQINPKHDKTAESNLNLSLWPQENQSTRNRFNKMILKPAPKTMIKQSRSADINDLKKLPELKGLSMHNIQRVTAWLTTNKNNQTYNADFQTFSKAMRDAIPRNPQITLPKPVFQSAPTEQRGNVYPFSKLSVPQQDYLMLPSNNRYKGINKYFQDSHVARKDDGLYLPMKPVRQLINKPIDQQPSYFHHEINDFDYFD